MTRGKVRISSNLDGLFKIIIKCDHDSLQLFTEVLSVEHHHGYL